MRNVAKVLLGVMLVTVGGCSSNSDPGANACGDGQEVTAADYTACVFAQS